MGKLHELLAVEPQLEQVTKAVIVEAGHTFHSKAVHFMGAQTVFTPFNDEEKHLSEASTQEMVTTVNDKLDYVFEHITRYLDAVLQKEATNQLAKADLIVDGVTLAKDVPATFLLGLESKIAFWKAEFLKIPTLAPGVKWTKDATRGNNVYVVGEPEVKFRTRKVVKHQILVQPTKEHPAQVEKWNEDTPWGRIVKNEWSGMMTPAEKSDLLGRMDRLAAAVKQARQRANCQEVAERNIGEAIAKFIMAR